jgi:signal transduction histidine kinase
MSEPTKLPFKVSSALKTILGKELITNNYIAILELVKNSFDADATRVDITFSGLTTENPKIIIQDNGQGMSRDDIEHKWLFVAYSAKKQTEDYRDKLSSGRMVAGAKGVGRFSCDRLGTSLSIYTRTTRKGAISKLDVQWSEFEEDQKSEFHKIPAHYSEIKNTPYDFEKGTILEISGLRDSDWNRNTLLELRRKLERLVNPNQTTENTEFGIFLHAPDELVLDAEQDDDWLKVNGEIRNRIFESFEIKTTQIIASISSDGKTVTTQLLDRGVKIFEIDEANPYPDLLHNISIHLFHLTRSAKVTFTRHMGIRIRDYGSVFLYKNGFRIHPFGDPDDDRLGIDRRKQQGHLRFLGTRDIAGRIEISGSNPDFQETTSRDGGIIETPAYLKLKDFFFDFALKRLEAYVINFSIYGRSSLQTESGALPSVKHIRDEEFQAWLLDWVQKLTKSEGVSRFDFDPRTLNVLSSRRKENVSGLIKNFERIAAEHDDPNLIKQTKRAQKRLNELLRAKEEAEAQAVTLEKSERAAQQKTLAAEKGKKSAENQALYLKSILARDDHLLASQHLILQETGAIINHAEGLLTAFDRSPLEIPDRWRERLSNLIINARKAEALSKFSTHANFMADTDELMGDLAAYIQQYIENVLNNKTPPGAASRRIPIEFTNPQHTGFTLKFMPIRIIIVIDNLISNAAKQTHQASSIKIEILGIEEDQLLIRFSDNGKGIDPSIAKEIFKPGFTTTRGSGLGLHHAQKLMREIGGTIVLEDSTKKGAHFLLRFKK